jgi:hypothetical protein
MGLFDKESREERFWQWFQKRADQLFDFESGQQRVFDELASALNRVEKGLTFEFGPKESGKREFIVSADGIRDRFEAVRRLVSAAPLMPQWVVIPFRPPKVRSDMDPGASLEPRAIVDFRGLTPLGTFRCSCRLTACL